MTTADAAELMPDTPERQRAHQRLLDEIAAEAAATASWTGRQHFSVPVMAALARVRRDAFVLPAEWPFAYDNRPLGIGHGQTISQPYIVALMTDLLDLTADDRVLEIGTGCGYQAAVLALLAARILAALTSATRTSAARTSAARTFAARTSSALTSAARTSAARTSAARTSSALTSAARTSAARG